MANTSGQTADSRKQLTKAANPVSCKQPPNTDSFCHASSHLNVANFNKAAKENLKNRAGLPEDSK